MLHDFAYWYREDLHVLFFAVLDRLVEEKKQKQLKEKLLEAENEQRNVSNLCSSARTGHE